MGKRGSNLCRATRKQHLYQSLSSLPLNHADLRPQGHPLGPVHEPASQEGHNGIVTGAGVSHQKLTDPNLSPLIFTPPAVRPPVHVPGARIELLIKPPLSAPTDEAAQPVVEAMLTQLNDHYFVMRSNRIKVGEVSSTGRPSCLTSYLRIYSHVRLPTMFFLDSLSCPSR